MTNWLNMFRPVGGLEQVFGFVTSDWKNVQIFSSLLQLQMLQRQIAFFSSLTKKGLNEEQEHTRIDLMGA